MDNVFQVSMLKKQLQDEDHIIQNFTELEIQLDASYVEKPMKIIGRKEKVLRRKIIPLVKVQWDKHGVEENTWEIEEDMRIRYPHLFEM